MRRSYGADGSRRIRRPDPGTLLAEDEQLRAWCLATEQSAFSGHTTIVGITDQRVVLTLKLETTSGATRKLTMRGGVGKLGGGEAQQQGIEALAEWLRAAG